MLSYPTSDAVMSGIWNDVIIVMGVAFNVPNRGFQPFHARGSDDFRAFIRCDDLKGGPFPQHLWLIE